MRSLKIEDIPALTDNERAAILLLREKLRRNFKLVKIILYGSKARGDHHDHSDVDLMVLVEDPKTWENREKLSDLQFEVIMQHDAPIMSTIENNQKWLEEQGISLPRYSEASRLLLKKSEGSYRSALLDIEHQLYDRAVSSLYYSAFQTVTAFMLFKEVRGNSHTQVRSFVNKELVRPGHIPVELGRMYNKLMDMRSDADYSVTVTFTGEHLETLAEQVALFNQSVRNKFASE